MGLLWCFDADTAPVSLAVIGREPGLYGSAFRDDVGDEQERERQQEQPRNPIRKRRLRRSRTR
jgi:hypothetical protein